MLACLPASGDPTLRILSRTQMNTGLQKWETTQKMRSASYPTPAELDAYAKKVANNPLSIQIFPNSVKVPQRKHIRRTVNGLDTSSSQRHSPYPSQVSSSRGLLAVLRAPAKGVIKESDGSRARQLHKVVMDPHSGPYATQSTLNLPQPAPHLQGQSQPQPAPHLQGQSQPQPAPHLQGQSQPQPAPHLQGQSQPAPHLQGQSQPAAQKQGMVHPQALQQNMAHPMTLQQPQTMPHPQALQQRSMAHSQAMQRQQSLSQVQPSQQRLAHPPGLQRQQSAPHTQALQHQNQNQNQSAPPAAQQQHLSHLQTLKHPTAPPQALLSQHSLTQDLRHMSDGAHLPSLQHTQGLVGSQPLPQAQGTGTPTMPNSLQQPPPGAYGPRKLPDADAPPNVTVSTSTIPLSMASSLHQNRPSDLSSIVQQINQLCQARAGMGATSVCEGQIANPSPISRNLLINASSRVSCHHPGLGSGPSCHMMGPLDKATAHTPNAALHSQPNTSAFHADPERLQLQQQHHHLHQQKQQQQQQQQLQQHQHLQQQLQMQQQQQQQRSWAQHQMAHMQQPPEGAHPCKNPRMEPPTECAFPSRNLNYSHKLPNTAQSFPLKHPAEKLPPSSPVNCPVGSMPYINDHYMQPQWGSMPATAGHNGSGPQDLPVSFQGGQAAASTDRIPGAKYRPGKEGPPAQSKLMQNVDFLGGEFQMPSFQEQNMEHVLEKMHRSAMSQVQEPNNGGGVHAHHPGYR
ncbi:protein FAM222B-like [Trematomus bernacchii]|uniref:protein FAM222B-like n=1 Tax=Trematomus bernacchii TaxID=40690 RepID=UPI00146A4571|nr:protein FAM222B-like [Trematomus bernacchii]